MFPTRWGENKVINMGLTVHFGGTRGLKPAMCLLSLRLYDNPLLVTVLLSSLLPSFHVQKCSAILANSLSVCQRPPVLKLPRKKLSSMTCSPEDSESIIGFI